MPSLSTADHRASPPRVDIPRDYNAAHDLIERNLAAGRAGKIAYIDDAGTYTYGELAERVNRCANALTGLGLQPEQRVLLCHLDTIDFPAVFLGAIKAGIVPIAANTLLTTHDYDYMLRDSRARALIVSAPLLPAFAPLLGKHPHLRARDRLRRGRRRGGGPAPFARAADGGGADVVRAGGDDLRRRLLLALFVGIDRRAQGHRAPAFEPDPDGGALREADPRHPRGRRRVLGGEAVLRLRPRQRAHLSAGRRRDDGADGRAPDAGGGVRAAAPPPADDLLRRADALRRAARESRPAEAGRARMRRCTSAGEALPAEIGRRWTEHFGVEILDGLGSTEMLHIFLSNRPGDVRYGTSGMPVPGYELQDRRRRRRSRSPPGEVGELQINGPTAAMAYWNNREKTRNTFQGPWTRSGDKYSVDADGYYVYSGRSDDMLKVGGIYVSPIEVESALITHPAVLEAAVIGRADDEELVKPMAYVVLKSRARRGPPALAEELRQHVKEQLAPYKYPRWIEFIDELPKTATGKIQRFKLRAKAP